MLNMYMIYKENIRITAEEELIKEKKKDLGSNYEVILENME